MLAILKTFLLILTSIITPLLIVFTNLGKTKLRVQTQLAVITHVRIMTEPQVDTVSTVSSRKEDEGHG